MDAVPAKINVQILGTDRPIVVESPRQAAACRPAGAHIMFLTAEALAGVKVDPMHLVVDIRPSKTAGSVNQHAIPCPADPAAHRPPHVDVVTGVKLPIDTLDEA